MKHIILLLILLSYQVYAIDLQSKIRNSDKGIFETVPDYQILDKYQFNFAISSSYTLKPLVEKNNINGKVQEKVLIDSLFDTEFSASMGINSFMELGILLPTMRTMGVDQSAGQDTMSIGDLFVESKFSLLPGLSLIPSLILPTGDSLNFTGTPEGGWGIRLVGSSYEWINIPLFFSFGAINTKNSKYRSINHEQRLQFSLGYLYSLNDKLSLASEVYGDKSEKNFPIELLAHATYHNDSFSLRGGLGSGFLANDSSNELKAFVSFIFDFGKFKTKKFNPILKDLNKISKRRKIRPKYKKVKEEKHLDKQIKKIKLNTFQEKKEKVVIPPPKIPVKKEEKKPDPFKEKVDQEMQEIKKILKDKKTNRSPSSESKKYNVLPFYSAKKIHQDTEEENKIKEYERHIKIYNKGINSLKFFKKQFDNKEISLKEVLVEFNWGLNRLHKRRVKMFNLKKSIKSKVKDIPHDIVIDEAREIFNNNKKTFRKIVKNERKKIKNEKETNTLSQEELRIKKEQENSWKLAKTHTLQDLIKEGKFKRKSNVKKEISSNSQEKETKLMTKTTQSDKEKDNSSEKKNVLKNHPKPLETTPIKKEKVSFSTLIDTTPLPILEEPKFKVKKANLEIPKITIITHDDILENLKKKIHSSYSNFYKKYKNNKIEKKKTADVEIKSTVMPIYVIEEEKNELAPIQAEEIKPTQEVKKEELKVAEGRDKDVQNKIKKENIESEESVEEYQDFVILENNEPVLIESGEIQKSLGPSF